MRQVYFIISSEDAWTLSLATFRKGNTEKGYVVNSGDLASAPRDIRNRAREVTEQEALDFIKEL